jgi:hypothetical protein
VRWTKRRVADCVWFAVPQATEWQRIGDQIEAALLRAYREQLMLPVESDETSVWEQALSVLGRT